MPIMNRRMLRLSVGLKMEDAATFACAYVGAGLVRLRRMPDFSLLDCFFLTFALLWVLRPFRRGWEVQGEA